MTSLFREAELKETREGLLWASNLTPNYIFMNILAAVIATYGLFSNSPAVIIGAMIVAMLLGPISSLALGIIESNLRLIRKSLITLLAGVLVVCFTAALLGLIHHKSPTTSEIMARTSPNFMDLMIAIAGGMAGALSLIHKKLATAFVGVAIATALVPPLASASILFVHGEYSLSLGAFLLTFTNIVGIQFGYSLVLWLSRVGVTSTVGHKKKASFIKRNLAGLTIMTILGIILSYNLIFVVTKLNFENSTRSSLAKQINAMEGGYLAEIRFDKEHGKLITRAVMRGPYAPDKNMIAAMESTIAPNYLHIPNELRIRFIKTDVITKDGELFKDYDK